MAKAKEDRLTRLKRQVTEIEAKNKVKTDREGLKKQIADLRKKLRG